MTIFQEPYEWNSRQTGFCRTSLPLLDVFYNQSDDQARQMGLKAEESHCIVEVYREPLRPKQFNKVLQQVGSVQHDRCDRRRRVLQGFMSGR